VIDGKPHTWREIVALRKGHMALYWRWCCTAARHTVRAVASASLAHTAQLAPLPAPGAAEAARIRRLAAVNPVAGLPAARHILALPAPSRRVIGILFRELAAECDAREKTAGRTSKGYLAWLWGVAATYARHAARAVDPGSGC
jgi:hypothetical protein